MNLIISVFFRAHDSLEINSLSRPLHVILLTIPHWIKILLFQDEPIALNYARIASYFALMSLPLQWVCIISIIILTNWLWYYKCWLIHLCFFIKKVFQISVDGIFAPVWTTASMVGGANSSFSIWRYTYTFFFSMYGANFSIFGAFWNYYDFPK